jgi:RND family efflux transporter MFP subunit
MRNLFRHHIAAGLYIVGAAFWGLPAAQAVESKAATQPVAAAVTVTKAARTEVVEAVTVTGTLVPRQEVLVGPEIEGLRILELLVDEGDKVAPGAVLARLSRETLEAQLAQSDAALARSDAAIAQAQSQISQTQANMTWTTQDLQRAQSLLARGASTQAAVDQKTSLARAAQAQLQAARDALVAAEADKKSFLAQRSELMVRLSRTEVKTPQGGIIARRNAKLGAVATAAGEPMFRIIANGAIELDAEVPEQRLLELREGQSAKITLADSSTVSGKIRLLSPEVDRTTRLGRVRISLESDSKARVGSFARASIELRRNMSVTVPASAIIYEGGKATLQIVVDGVVRAKPVEVGFVNGSRAEVLKGLSEGETVVVRAGPFLREGDAVTPVTGGGGK